MATSADDARDKTVTGYPATAGQYAPGYPAAAAAPPYPYMAQPPPPHNNAYRTMAPTPYYNPQPIGTKGPAPPTLLRRLIIAAVVVFTIMSLVSFIAWLAFRPKELPYFQINGGHVSPLNVTAGQLTATWDITVFASNPNHKIAIHYDQLQAGLLYGADDLRIATTPLPPFVLVKQSQTLVKFKFAAVAKCVGNDIAKGISDERDRGWVGFRVLVLASVRFKSGIFQSRPRSLRAYCSQVDFGFGPPWNKNGTGLMGEPGPCKVDL